MALVWMSIRILLGMGGIPFIPRRIRIDIQTRATAPIYSGQSLPFGNRDQSAMRKASTNASVKRRRGAWASVTRSPLTAPGRSIALTERTKRRSLLKHRS